MAGRALNVARIQRVVNTCWLSKSLGQLPAGTQWRGARGRCKGREKASEQCCWRRRRAWHHWLSAFFYIVNYSSMSLSWGMSKLDKRSSLRSDDWTPAKMCWHTPYPAAFIEPNMCPSSSSSSQQTLSYNISACACKHKWQTVTGTHLPSSFTYTDIQFSLPHGKAAYFIQRASQKNNTTQITNKMISCHWNPYKQELNRQKTFSCSQKQQFLVWTWTFFWRKFVQHQQEDFQILSVRSWDET